MIRALTRLQDTCYDVQHKKRGRPRLREESDPRTDQAEQPVSFLHSSSTFDQQTPTRPIASTRSRRAESFRSHQSRGSESSSYGQITPRTANFPNFQLAPGYGPTPGIASPEMPTAILDLGLVFLQANASFQQIIAGGRGLSGRRLADVANPADGHSFSSIRNRLRTEREVREPSYLPPILQSGQSPLEGVQDSDIDHLAQGFSDVTYQWTTAPPDPSLPPFPARLRLAKASTYFAVITLPSFRPVPQQSPAPQRTFLPFMTGPPPPPPAPEMYHGPRQTMAQSIPPMFQSPYERAAGPASHPPPATAPPMRVYAPPELGGPGPSFQRPVFPTYQPMTAPYHSMPPPADVAVYQPPPPPPQPQVRRMLPGPESLLAPTAAGSARPATVAPPEGAQSGGSSSEEGGEGGGARSPNKRRRMGISEVLQ